MPADADNIISVAVETSGRIGSVAVARGPQMSAGSSFSTQHHHGVELLPTVDALCRQAGVEPRTIEHVYVSGGPGSFTGLRIGITFAKALALAVGAKVVRVPTLEVIAQNALTLDPHPQRVVVILDAKRRHMYAALFELCGESYTPVDEADERDPSAYLPALGPVAALGDGIVHHAAAVDAADNVAVQDEDLNRARAEQVHRLGRRMAVAQQFASIDELVPIYVRRPDAEEKWEQRQQSARG